MNRSMPAALRVALLAAAQPEATTAAVEAGLSFLR
jgi:hypothetical protein